MLRLFFQRMFFFVIVWYSGLCGFLMIQTLTLSLNRIKAGLSLYPSRILRCLNVIPACSIRCPETILFFLNKPGELICRYNCFRLRLLFKADTTCHVRFNYAHKQEGACHNSDHDLNRHQGQITS